MIVVSIDVINHATSHRSSQPFALFRRLSLRPAHVDHIAWRLLAKLPLRYHQNIRSPPERTVLPLFPPAIRPARRIFLFVTTFVKKSVTLDRAHHVLHPSYDRADAVK